MLFNKERAIKYMDEAGLDVLVATSPVNVTYFTDYYCWVNAQMKDFMMTPGGSLDLSEIFRSYAVFPREGEPAPPARGRALARKAQTEAERAVEKAVVPSRYHRYIQRYFGRLEETVEKAAGGGAQSDDQP